MGLLKLLGIEKPLPRGLADDSNSIKQATKALNLSKQQDKQLALTDTAETIAKNLAALQKKVEPRLYERKCEELASLATRISQRKATDPALVTDAMEMKMLAAETEVALKDSKGNRKKLEDAQAGFAGALVTRLDQSGDLTADMNLYFDNLLAGESTARLGAALKALSILKDSPDNRVKLAAAAVTKRLAEANQKTQRDMGPSTAERDTSRTPNDVLVHLMTEVNKALKTHADDVDLKAVAARGRKLFMTHAFDGPAVASLIEDAKEALEALDEDGAVAMCGKLAGQLPKDDAKLTPAQLQDNLYGRVFDSKVIGALVKNPPPELLASATTSGSAFADMLDDTEKNRDAAKKLRDHYVVEDVRPWSKAVPGFQDIEDAKDGAESLAALKKFLKTPPTTGQEIIAYSYLMTKMSIAQQQEGAPPEFMKTAGTNYGAVIMPQAKRDRSTASAKVLSEGAGITLLHQPNAVDDDTLVPSERPGTTNRFGQRNLPQNQDKGLDEMERTPATIVQHEKSLPFASGVSGSTNIMLHMYAELKAKGMVGVSAREFMMNAMMFLVYDGGHSMHEVMWTANQLDTALGLGLNLGDPTKPAEFVSDYDTLTDGFGDSMKTAMGDAMDEAWNGTQDYLEKNSVFAE